MFGARPLKRLVQREVVDAIAAAIIDGRAHEGDKISLDVDSDGKFEVAGVESRDLGSSDEVLDAPFEAPKE